MSFTLSVGVGLKTLSHLWLILKLKVWTRLMVWHVVCMVVGLYKYENLLWYHKKNWGSTIKSIEWHETSVNILFPQCGIHSISIITTSFHIWKTYCIGYVVMGFWSCGRLSIGYYITRKKFFRDHIIPLLQLNYSNMTYLYWRTLISLL